MRFLALLTVLLLTALPAHAEDPFDRYVTPNINLLTDYAFDSGLVKLQQNSDVVEYLQLKDCTLYNMAKDNIFMQQQMMTQIASGQAERTKKFNKNLHLRIKGSDLNITRYNFTTQSFDIDPAAQWKNVGLLTVLEFPDLPCGTSVHSRDLKLFPNKFALKLNYPITMLRIPMQSAAAKNIYEKLDANANNKKKLLFSVIYISVEGTGETVKEGLGYTRRATLLGQVDAIDIFSDYEHTKRIKRFDFRTAY